MSATSALRTTIHFRLDGNFVVSLYVSKMHILVPWVRKKDDLKKNGLHFKAYPSLS